MALWETREQALLALETELEPEEKALQELFDAADECVERLGRIDSAPARVTALTVIKGRNLALSCYSLALDGLAQEAGALFRVLIEVSELLTYFRLDPERIQQAIDGQLPSAGVIAQRIGGKFEALRQHLNANASHFSFKPDALRHLLDWHDGVFRSTQPFGVYVLKKNLHVCLSVFVCVAIEAMLFLTDGSGDVNRDLAYRINTIYDAVVELTRSTLER